MWGGAWASAWQAAWSRLMGAATGTTTRPGTGALTATGYAPTVTAIEDGAPVVVSTGAIEATGFAPTVTATQSGSDVGVIAYLSNLLRRPFRRGRMARVTAPAASLRWDAFAPTVSALVAVRITPPDTRLESVGFAPRVPRVVVAPAGDVRLIGYPPMLRRPVTVEMPAALLNCVAYAPLVQATTRPPSVEWTAADDEEDVEALLLLVGAAF